MFFEFVLSDEVAVAASNVLRIKESAQYSTTIDLGLIVRDTPGAKISETGKQTGAGNKCISTRAQK